MKTPANPGTQADITVVICTRNRAESLRQTLDCLIRADRTGLNCEVVVVDNGGADHTAEVARAAREALPVHYLMEPRPGKTHAMNRALDDAPMGDIIAVLDDDMSPQAGWWRGVKAICDRWPDKDLFTGRSHVIWPGPDVPDWCQHRRLRGWAFSVMGVTEDTVLADGRWFSGNHFWFRSRVLADGRRFGTGNADTEIQIYLSEPQFMLNLAADGFGGVMGPDAVCGHRVQPELLKFEVLRERSRRAGRGFAVARLQPYKRTIKQARLFRDHPILSRLFCLASIVGWMTAHAGLWLHPVRAERIALQLQAIQRRATYREYLRIAGRMEEYRVFGRRREARS
jgi:glycosyltransferase involved in cell wall biosynthesis